MNIELIISLLQILLAVHAFIVLTKNISLKKENEKLSSKYYAMKLLYTGSAIVSKGKDGITFRVFHTPGHDGPPLHMWRDLVRHDDGQFNTVVLKELLSQAIAEERYEIAAEITNYIADRTPAGGEGGSNL